MEKSNIKFTSDGKKVIVIGSLNSNEKIVQEIFIVDGSEIPSGEHFVVKSLHDAPSISWKEKHLKDIDLKYETVYKAKQQDLEKIEKDFNLKSATIKSKLSFLRSLDLKMKEEDLEQFINFVSGDIKFIVVDRYGELSIDSYDNSIVSKEYGRFDSLRLVSVFGRTDGELSYRRNEYYDGSGSWSNIYPFQTYEDALSKLKELFNEKVEKGVTESLMKVSQQYGLFISKEAMDVFNKKNYDQIMSNIESHKKNIKDYEEKLLKYKTD